MNKFISKIAVALVGCAMAVGVGVAIGNNSGFSRAEAATGNVAIDLSTTNDISGSATNDSAVIAHTTNNVTASITAAKNDGTSLVNAYPGKIQSGTTYYTEWRFYNKNTWSISAVNSSSVAMYITSIEVTCASSSNATSLAGMTWGNATAAVDGQNNKKVNVTPGSNKTSVTLTFTATIAIKGAVIYWSDTAVVTTPTITLSSDSLTVGYGCQSTINVVWENLTEDISVAKTSGAGGVSFSSTIDYDGAVSPLAFPFTGTTVGTVIISFSSAGATTKTLTITVSDTTAYELVTDGSNLTPGTKFIIVDSGKNYALGTTFSSGVYSGVSVTISGSTARSLNAQEFVLGGSSGSWTFKAGDNFVGLSAISGNGKFSRNATIGNIAYAYWNISIANQASNYVASIAVNTNDEGNYKGIFYNYNSGNTRFTNYASSNDANLLIYAVLSANLSASSNSATVDVGGTDTSITLSHKNFGGTPDIEVISSDAEVATGSVSTNVLTINGLSAGSATLTITASRGGKESSVEIEVSVINAERAFIGIYSTGEKKSAYVGELFVFGGTVYAVYDDDSEDDVTSNCTFSGYNMSAANTYTVTITYTEEDSDNITTYQLTVSVFPYSKATSLNGGDKVIFTNAAETKYFGAVNTFASAIEYTTYPSISFAYTIVAGASDGTIAFKDADGKYLSWTSGNTLNLYEIDGVNNTELTANQSWTVEFDGTAATISNSADDSANGRIIKFNTDRFATYSNANNPNVFIWKLNGSNGSTEALSFASSVDGFMKDIGTDICDNDGILTDTDDLADAWGTYAGLYDSLSAEAKAYIASRSANASGNDVDKMLSLYNYIYEKYGDSLSLSNFLARIEAARLSNPKISQQFITSITKESSTTLIIIIASLVSLTAIGGYFFIRRRKER